MTGRSRALFVWIAVLLMVVTLAVSGCTGGLSNLSRMENGGYKYTEGGNIWTWERSGNAEQLSLNDMMITVIQGGHAQFTLTNGQKLDVTMDNTGTPATIKMSYGTVVSQDDYTQMNKVLSVRERILQEVGGAQTGSVGLAIVLVLVIILGVLLFLYAGRLVSSWKLGGIFSGHDTAKSLLLFKAIGIVVAMIGLVIFLVVVF